jgi:hypothetical protein
VENGRESEGKIAGNRETRFPVQLVKGKCTGETRRSIYKHGKRKRDEVGS